MGHNRLGRLPKTQRWNEVVALLDLAPQDTSSIAAAVAEAADYRFRRLADDPALTYCFWLLTRVAWASRGSFFSELHQLGIPATADTSTIALISQVSEHVRRELARIPSSSHFGEIASLSLQKALAETVGQQGGSLFATRGADVERAFRTFSTRDRFGELAHRFFSDFMSRSLRSFVDRELANHIGPGHGFTSIADSREFMTALDVHTRQSARILEDFAAGWYSKHNWESRGEITLDETQRFVAYGLRKLRSELKRSAGAT